MQAAGQSHPGNAPVWSTWTDRIPSRPLCADIFADGTLRRPRPSALSYPHVEFNTAGRVSWLNFDVDTPESFETWDRTHLPVPNAYVQNPANGHGHLLYALNVPVGVLGLSRERPIHLVADVQRGMTKRLGADPAYCNRLAKNPSSPRWRTSWYANKPYTLNDLLGALDRTDVRKPDCRTETSGISRNCDLFNELRQFAYGNVLAAKRSGSTRTPGENASSTLLAASTWALASHWPSASFGRSPNRSRGGPGATSAMSGSPNFSPAAGSLAAARWLKRQPVVSTSC